MKNLFKILLCLVLLSSCSKDDEEVSEVEVPVIENVFPNGNYIGRAGEFGANILVFENSFTVIINEINENVELDNFTEIDFDKNIESMQVCHNYCYNNISLQEGIINLKWEFIRYNRKLPISINLIKQ